jgi:hypothetical protein
MFGFIFGTLTLAAGSGYPLRQEVSDRLDGRILLHPTGRRKAEFEAGRRLE